MNRQNTFSLLEQHPLLAILRGNFAERDQWSELRSRAEKLVGLAGAAK